MKLLFIAQGISSQSGFPAGNKIVEALLSQKYSTFMAFSAFASKGGIENMMDSLNSFRNNGGTIKLFLGVDLHGTSKEALEYLLEHDITTYIVHSPNAVVFHPKIYLFLGQNEHLIIVGSSNLTRSGLFQNIESSLCASFPTSDSEGMELEQSILDYYHEIINGQSDSCNLLSQQIIDLLVDTNTVLSEQKKREISNTENRSLPQVTCSNREKLSSTFKPIHIAKPPKGHGRTISNEVITPGHGVNEATVVFLNEELSNNAMWIETGRMTGGSRNILDLSKQGKRDGIEKFGSVEFFNVDKNDYSHQIDITLIYNGEKYIGNTIKYAERNSNWRIQLKGISSTNQKLTNIFKENGSQDKIFIFERTDDPLIYNFFILSSDELEHLIDISTDWANGGKTGAGRKYGLIN